MKKNSFSLLFPRWSEEINLSLLENNTYCVALFSRDKELLFSNPAMRSLFKENNPWQNFLHPDLTALLSEAKQSTLVYKGFITIGNLNSVNTSIQAEVYVKNDEVLIIGGVEAAQLIVQNERLHDLNQDISNLQRQLIKEKINLENTLRELNEANNKLEQLNATKDKLFSIIAHDLKNPFIVLLGYSELLADDVDQYSPEMIREFAGNILTASENTYELLENLLEWSKVQTGLLNPRPVMVSPGEIILEVVELCRQQAEAKEINLDVLLEFNETMKADKEMLRFILRNLLTNAIKYTSSKGEIKLKTSLIEKAVEFSVQDNGTGIEPQYIDKLFKIENKLTRLGTLGEKGSGLGLILCSEFVEKHGGKLNVESQPDKGSIFYFSIPLEKDA